MEQVLPGIIRQSAKAMISYRYIFILFCILSGASAVRAQSVRFLDEVFPDVTISRNLSYKATIPAGTKKKYYQYDWYEASGDTARMRPLIIWLHGGGFKFGKKTSAGTPVWSRSFAKRGYVCAAINYRLSKKHPLKDFADLAEGCMDAIADTHEAIGYFKKMADSLRIDPKRIFLGGNSAGGMIALQSVYSSPAEMAALIHRGNSSLLPSIHNPDSIAAAISCWGALFDLRWMQNTRVPFVSVHGSRDRVVPPDNGKDVLYGGIALNRMADSIGLPHAFHLFEGVGHELQAHFNPLFAGGAAKRRWEEAGRFIAVFLYDQFFKDRNQAE
jgi:acetyl esterase/lipase